MKILERKQIFDRLNRYYNSDIIPNKKYTYGTIWSLTCFNCLLPARLANRTFYYYYQCDHNKTIPKNTIFQIQSFSVWTFLDVFAVNKIMKIIALSFHYSSLLTVYGWTPFLWTILRVNRPDSIACVNTISKTLQRHHVLPRGLWIIRLGITPLLIYIDCVSFYHVSITYY